jgi:hypothetical protein
LKENSRSPSMTETRSLFCTGVFCCSLVATTAQQPCRIVRRKVKQQNGPPGLWEKEACVVGQTFAVPLIDIAFILISCVCINEHCVVLRWTGSTSFPECASKQSEHAGSVVVFSADSIISSFNTCLCESCRESLGLCSVVLRHSVEQSCDPSRHGTVLAKTVFGMRVSSHQTARYRIH